MRLNKILLLIPPAFSRAKPRDITPLPPMGLGYLASIAENLGIEVKIFDCLMLGWEREEYINETLVRVGLPNQEIQKQIRQFQPDMVGINCQFSRQYKIYHEIFALIKNIDSRIIVLAGGPHATVCPEEVLRDDNCDYLLQGEAEESFHELIMALESGQEITSIDGLGWKQDDKVKINPKLKFINDLDSIPFPAYHLMGLDKYFGLKASHGERHKNRFSPIVTSRGCPAKCTFCSANQVWGNKYRVRSVEKVIEEMRLLKDNYGIEEIMFEDDNVTANNKRAKHLFSRMIEEDFDFVWDTPNGAGVWNMDEEMIDLIKKSGCVGLHFPVESGSQEILKNVIKKPVNLERVKELTKYCKKINLYYSMFLVIGMPGETLADMWKSIKFAADCGCYIPHISVATPYPGTQLYETCLKNGYFSKPFSLDDLFIRSFLLKTPDWDGDDVKKLLYKGNHYLRIRELMANPLKIFNYFKSFFKLLLRPTRIFEIIKQGY